MALRPDLTADGIPLPRASVFQPVSGVDDAGISHLLRCGLDGTLLTRGDTGEGLNYPAPSQLTALTGGVAGCLDAFPAAALPTGYLVFLSLASNQQMCVVKLELNTTPASGAQSIPALATANPNVIDPLRSWRVRL